MVSKVLLDAYCPHCDEVRKHEVEGLDRGGCKCTVCGHEQQMYKPLGSDA
jgi:hypothetical protein